MANPQERSVNNSETAPLKGDGYTVTGDDYEEATAFCGHGCFRNVFRIRWRRDGKGQEERRESWVTRKVKGLKELTEIIAGPKWKNFIRRIITNKKIKKNLQYQYDLNSYALNFDEGFERPFPDFPARFAAPVLKNGTELGHDSSAR